MIRENSTKQKASGSAKGFSGSADLKTENQLQDTGFCMEARPRADASYWQRRIQQRRWQLLKQFKKAGNIPRWVLLINMCGPVINSNSDMLEQSE